MKHEKSGLSNMKSRAPIASSANLLDPIALRQDFPILHQEVAAGRPLVYLDNAATTQRPQSVIDAVVASYQHNYANVHRGLHELSERSTADYEHARRTIARFIGAADDREVILTSGTTLAINTVARAWGDVNVGPGDEILLTMMEHHGNIVPWQQLAERRGAVVKFIDITEDGLLDWDDLHRQLSPRTKLLAVTAISNVLGTINPIAELVAAAHAQGALVLVDAAQHVPHCVTDVHEWNADFVCFSGHKMLGPSGFGVLYGRRALLETMPAFLGGGNMIREVTTRGYVAGELPAKFEAGTPPIVSAIATRAAIEYLERVGLPAIQQHVHRLTELCLERLADLPSVRVLGPSLQHRAGIVSFVVAGVSPQDISILIDRQGIAIRAGHHCAMPLHDRLGVPNSCRASFYLYNTEEDVHRFADALQHVITRLT
jgi:cysteine desulfurase/selenocysteine lyase